MPAVRTMHPTLLLLYLTIAAAAGATPTLPQSPTGTWEGQMEDPRRPTVITVDFTNRTLSFSGGDPVALAPPAANRGSGVEFEVSTGGQTLRFAGVRSPTRIDGTVRTGTEEGSFWLEPLPDTAPPSSHAEAWRQDID